MACSICFFKNPLPRIAVLVAVLVCAGFLGFGFLPVLFTTSFLILSSIFFTSKKHKPVPEVETSMKEESVTSDQKISPQVEEVVSEKLEQICLMNHVDPITIPQALLHQETFPESEPQKICLRNHIDPATIPHALLHQETFPESETITQQQIKEAQEGDVGQTRGYLVGTILDSFSETESIDDQSSTTDQDSEADWPYSGNVGQSPDCSDDSISDEESLIEIALPSGHYVGPEKEDPISKCNLEQKFPDFSPQPELILKQHSLMELLAEANDMNEEDNLIEIDISMGSIKCSRFEIEA